MPQFGHGPSILDLAKREEPRAKIIPHHSYIFCGHINTRLVREDEIGQFMKIYAKEPERLKVFFETELVGENVTSHDKAKHYMSCRHLCPELDVFINMLNDKDMMQATRKINNKYTVEWHFPVAENESKYLHGGLKYPHVGADNVMAAFLHVCFEPVFRMACAPFKIKGDDIGIYYTGGTN